MVYDDTGKSWNACCWALALTNSNHIAYMHTYRYLDTYELYWGTYYMICSEASSFFPFPISVSHSTKKAWLQVMRICVRNKRSKCLLKQHAQTQTKTAKIEQHSAFMCIPHPHRILTSISPSVDPKNHRVACIFAWMVLACAAGARKIQKAQIKHKTSQDSSYEEAAENPTHLHRLKDQKW